MIKKFKNLKLKKPRHFKIKDEYKSFYKLFFISLIVIPSFFVLPDTVNLLNKIFTPNKIIINASKQIFDETLIKKKNKKVTDQIEKDFVKKDDAIYSDDIGVYPKDKNVTDPPRLSASTIEEIFNQTKYDLKKVKETKLVNVGNEIPMLPKELKNIASVKKRKELFIKIVLPLIAEENNRIKFDRKKLFVILNKSNNTELEKQWLKTKFKQYSVRNNDLSTLKIRMDEIPVSLAIAQAAKETGWGTSRFAQEGNALFGQWTWSGDGIRPAAVDKNAKHKVARFTVLKASVKAYQRNLNTHPSYGEFRKERAIQRDNDGKLNSLELVKFLDKYAETGIEYTIVLKKIIKQNSLRDYDDVEILPTSLKLKSLI
tara:strand:+ start:5162 stop:6274 length:1113 start_codon:yes stop_codon:yes gene_type:complete